MKKKLFKAPRLVVLVVILMVAMLLPVAARADVLQDSGFWGTVTVNGQNAPPGTTVTAWIAGVTGGPWTVSVVTVGGITQFQVSIPADNPNTLAKDGGVNGDTVHFTVNVGGAAFDAGSGIFRMTSLQVLDLSVNMPLAITTSILPRWPAEKGPSLPPVPGWVKGKPYTASLMAVGGRAPYSWNATMPPGLNISTAGAVTGTPTTAGLYFIVFTVTDSSTPPATVSRMLPIQIYVKGGAAGGSSVTGADMAYLLQVLVGGHPPNAGADANLDGTVNGADVAAEQTILLGGGGDP